MTLLLAQTPFNSGLLVLEVGVTAQYFPYLISIHIPSVNSPLLQHWMHALRNPKALVYLLRLASPPSISHYSLFSPTIYIHFVYI